MLILFKMHPRDKNNCLSTAKTAAQKKVIFRRKKKKKVINSHHCNHQELSRDAYSRLILEKTSREFSADCV